eukprot:TRINITY_DN6128_c0_g1_i5.p1 TRINITY_DN6128_c0_g1~~TRINITY_DN6128_c0_g1_i5.p1  ORF type:complete len:323 (+),score=51.23 TRINITY_DN6128_c0_g1_i5:159-1127(+)
MCIRDRYQRRVRGKFLSAMSSASAFVVLIALLSASSASASGCVDKTIFNPPVPFWDSGGTQYTCAWYEGGSNRCHAYGGGYRNDGLVANEACCVCGGGTTTTSSPTTAPTVPPLPSCALIENTNPKTDFEYFCPHGTQINWHSSITPDPSSCAVKVTTRQSNCKTWCAGIGMVCTSAQDNTGPHGQCGVYYDHTRQTTAENGCLQNWGDQICACGLATSASPTANPTATPTITHDFSGEIVFSDKESIDVANSATVVFLSQVKSKISDVTGIQGSLITVSGGTGGRVGYQVSPASAVSSEYAVSRIVGMHSPRPFGISVMKH